MKKFWMLLLLLALAGCSSGGLSVINALPGEELYRESFSDPASGWERSSTQVGTLDYFNGVYRITVNPADYDLWAVAGRDYSDVRLEVEAARFGGPAENRFGLICRYRDALDFYFFVISSDGYYTLGKVSGGELTLLGQPEMAYNASIVTGMSPNHLRFDCVGETLTGYINGQMVAVTQDASYRDGDVGLLAGSFDTPGVEVIFDDLVVIKP